LSDADALQIVADRRGTMYDPDVVDSFFSLHSAAVAAPSPSPQPAASLPPPAAVPAAPRQEISEGRQDAQDLRAFFDLGRALAASSPRSAVGEVLWTHLKTRLPASTFVLFAYDDASDALVAIYASNPWTTVDRMERVPLGDRLSGWVAATGQTIVNSDARLDVDAAERERSPLRSALAVPIVSHGRTTGVLSFYASVANAFDERHKELAEAAAAAIAEAPLAAAQAIDAGTRDRLKVSK
jgi:GAF domain-containing protein